MPEGPVVTPPAFARIVDVAPDGYVGQHRANEDGTPARPPTVTARAYIPQHAAEEGTP